MESATSLKEVGEVLLIEDGSEDSSLEICAKIQMENSKVRLFRHPNGENRGASASRNLGLKKASLEFIAFLDSDDWYLSNRFFQTKEEFKNNEVDGVYEPIGTFFYQDESYLFGKKLDKVNGEKIVTFLKKPVQSKELFYSLLSQENGNFSTDGITLRKSLIERIGLFSLDLEIHEDTEFWIRCAYFGNLVAPLNPSVVAMRGVHGNNSNNKVNFYSKAKFYNEVFHQFHKENLTFKEKFLLYKKFIFFNIRRKHQNSGVIKKYGELSMLAGKILFNSRKHFDG